MGTNSGDASLSAFSNAITNRVRAAGPSIVAVRSHRARGSGFVWRPGRIVTADEALADEGPVEVRLPGGEVVSATVKGRDASTDVALLAVDRTDVPPIPPAAEASIEAGALALVVGARDGSPTASLGIVAHAGPAWRSLRGGSVDARIELDVALRRSSEGGVVVDAAGTPLGMAVFGPRRRVLAIPMRTIDRVAAALDAEGRVARGYLGLGLQAVRVGADAVGAMVMFVDDAGPAAAAGVRQGDVVVAWDGHAITGVASILRELGAESVGRVVHVAARRAGEPVDFDIAIGTRRDA